MKYCPITYDSILPNENYSVRGLHLLSPQLRDLKPFTLTTEELNKEALNRAGKMSIQGVQPKLSAQLKISKCCFDIVDQKGYFILKPQSINYPELPENEAITMTLASQVGLEIPVHGLIYSKDKRMVYFIKRFDRLGRTHKIATEDFAQLSGLTRDTKYRSSMEQVANIIEKYCTFPKIELVKLFKLTLFSYLVGNEDMHLKNFSLITKKNIITLSPAYDLLNTTIALADTEEELALSINGKKSNLKKSDFIDYFAKQKLKLNDIVINEVLDTFQQAIPQWKNYLDRSFLSIDMREKYLSLLMARSRKLGLTF